MITHPFSDPQVDIVYALLKDEWMPTRKDYHRNNEYIWKVLMPECFIKFYMDFFNLDKPTAELKIKETPFNEEEEKKQKEKK